MKIVDSVWKWATSIYRKHLLILFAGLSFLAIVVFWLVVRNSINTDSWINVAVLALIPFAMGWAGVYLAAANRPLFVWLFTFLFILGVGLTWFQQYRVEKAKERHLTKEQIAGLGKFAEAIPKDIGVLVRFPPNSDESKRYAMEFWNVFHEHHVRCGLPIIAGVEPPSPGLHIYVISLFTPAGRPAEDFMSGMESVGLHPFWGENYPWADPKVFIIYVGPKESYD